MLPGSDLPGAASVIHSGRAQNLNDYHLPVSRARSILVIGAGSVGVELAAEIISHFPDKTVTLVGPILSRMPERAQRYAAGWLQGRGVVLLSKSKVAAYLGGESFQLTTGETVLASLAFVCTGNVPNASFLRSSKDFAPLLSERGFALVNDHFQLAPFKHVFAGGDLAAPIGDEEKLAAEANAVGSFIADNIYRMHYQPGVPLKSWSPARRPIVISLGKVYGIFCYLGWTLTGFVPACMKEVIEWKELLAFRYKLPCPPLQKQSHLHSV
jgi:NADH dehydrogenase FAD-containing subunit